MASLDGRVLGEFSDYDSMLAVVRARVEELAIKGRAFDAFAGLPAGYLSKLIGQNPIRRIAMTSMGPVFLGLGIRCVVIEDPAGTARLKNRLQPRNNSFVRAAPRIMLTERVWRQLQKRGRMARWQKLTKQQRSEIMRQVIAARWKRHHAAQRRRNNGDAHAQGPPKSPRAI